MSANRPILVLVADLPSARLLARELRHEEVDATILVGDGAAGLRAIHRLDPVVVLAHARLLRGELLGALRAGTLPPLAVLGEAESPGELIAMVDAGAFAAIEMPTEPGLLGRVLRRGRALHELESDPVAPPLPGEDGADTVRRWALETEVGGGAGHAGAAELAWRPVVHAEDLRVFGYEVAEFGAIPGVPRLDRPPALARLAAELDRPTPRGAVLVTWSDDDAVRAVVGTDADPLSAHALRVILQVRATAEVGDPRTLVELGGRLHDRGYRIALSGLDVGVDHLAHLLALRPELVRLGPSSWKGTKNDAQRRHLVRSLEPLVKSPPGAASVVRGVATWARAGDQYLTSRRPEKKPDVPKDIRADISSGEPVPAAAGETRAPGALVGAGFPRARPAAHRRGAVPGVL